MSKEPKIIEKLKGIEGIEILKEEDVILIVNEIKKRLMENRNNKILVKAL